MNVIPYYAAYLVVAVGLAVWLARTLFANGAVFLADTFGDRPQLAAAINQLLVTGFFMLNLGYAMFLVRADRPVDATAAVEHLARRLGVLLVSLAVIHFANLIVFNRVRALGRPGLPPLAPTDVVPPPPPAPMSHGPVPAAPFAPAR